jgi:hypothetical protein
MPTRGSPEEQRLVDQIVSYGEVLYESNVAFRDFDGWAQAVRARFGDAVDPYLEPTFTMLELEDRRTTETLPSRAQGPLSTARVALITLVAILAGSAVFAGAGTIRDWLFPLSADVPSYGWIAGDVLAHLSAGLAACCGAVLAAPTASRSSVAEMVSALVLLLSALAAILLIVFGHPLGRVIPMFGLLGQAVGAAIGARMVLHKS